MKRHLNILVKKLHKPFALASALLLLSACATLTSAQVDTHLSGWRSHGIDELMAAFGLPSSQRDSDDAHYALWTAQETKTSPTFSIGLGGSSGNVSAGVGTTLFGGSNLHYCTVQALYDANGLVNEIRWNGNTNLCVEKFPAINSANEKK